MDSAIVELREDLKHERDRRYALTNYVRKQCKDREADRAKDRADYAFAQFRSSAMSAPLLTSWGNLAERSLTWMERSLFYAFRQMQVLKRGVYLHRRNRARTDSTGGDTPRKT